MNITNYSPLATNEGPSEFTESQQLIRECSLFGTVQNALTKCASWVLGPDIDIGTRKILEESASKTRERREKIRQQVDYLRQGCKTDRERKKLESAVAAIPPNQWESVYTNVLIFLPEYKGDIGGLVRGIAKLPANERTDVCRNAVLLAPFGRYKLGELLDLFHAIAQIPIEERADVCEKILPLMIQNGDASDSFSSFSSITKKLLESLSHIPKEQRTDACKKAVIIAEKLCQKGLVQTQYSFPRSEEEITGFDKIRAFWYRAGSLEFISKIPVEQQKDAIAKAIFLINNFNMSSYGINDLSKILVKISTDELIDAVQMINFFISGRTTQNSRHPDYKTAYVRELLPILLTIPSEDRLKHLERMEEWLLEEFGNEWLDHPHYRYPPDYIRVRYDESGSLVHHYGQTPIKIWLDHPLDQPLPKRQGRMAAAAERKETWIDVHDGSRELQTQKALQLLREHQADTMNAEEAAEAAQDCVACLKQKTEDVELKRKLERVLFALEAPLKPGGKDWGPLLTEPHEDPNNLYGAGREALGRLWLYIHSLPDQADQDNTFTSLISVLDSSVLADNNRICNPGKIERLFIAILQGRLEGVLIDDSIDLAANPSSKKLTAESLKIFFENEDHQKITNRKDLIETSLLFCKANPTINRMGFLSLLDQFMAADPETFTRDELQESA